MIGTPLGPILRGVPLVSGTTNRVPAPRPRYMLNQVLTRVPQMNLTRWR
jgi:hypothetical protein